MKRILCLLLCLCLLLSLAACRKDPEPTAEPESTKATENQPPTETQAPAGTQTPTESQTPTEATEIRNGEEPDGIRLLQLEKTLHTYYEWADELSFALVRSEHASVTLGQEDAEAYPEMAEVFRQIAIMQENTMLEEFYNLVSFARDDLSWGSEGFETYVSTLDVQVRRADSLVISLLSDSYTDFAHIQNYRAFHGSNYDTRTGRELMINEVVDVNNDLALAVQAELTGHMWTGEFYSESTVEDYFANMPYDGFSWTLDYTGITFYFAPGELWDGGAMTATVSFEKYPELFNEKYMEIPDAYTVELPLDISFFTNLDGNDALEEFFLSGWYDAERNHYLDYGVFTDADGMYFCEECYIYDLHPYYVKAESGNYLYLFCEDFDEGMRQMRLVVLRLNTDGSVSMSGEINVGPSWLADNRFCVPTDPGCLLLDDPDNGAERTAFAVGHDGMPCHCSSDS